GYLTKDGEPETILDAVRAVGRGGHYVAQSVAAGLVYDGLDQEADAPHRSLSNREYEVFIALARGSRISDISERLHISPKTVSTHKLRALQKLALRTEAELVGYALRRGLID